jgi:hypothetical protein
VACAGRSSFLRPVGDGRGGLRRDLEQRVQLRLHRLHLRGLRLSILPTRYKNKRKPNTLVFGFLFLCG